MVRLSPPDDERLEQAPRLQVRIGGAEWNVACSLARLGLGAAWVSRLTRNPLGQRIAAEARFHGVDTDHVVWTNDDRVGVYYLEPGPPPARLAGDLRPGGLCREPPPTRAPRHSALRARPRLPPDGHHARAWAKLPRCGYACAGEGPRRRRTRELRCKLSRASVERSRGRRHAGAVLCRERRAAGGGATTPGCCSAPRASPSRCWKRYARASRAPRSC